MLPLCRHEGIAAIPCSALARGVPPRAEKSRQPGGGADGACQRLPLAITNSPGTR